jgi:hypothetical protein
MIVLDGLPVLLVFDLVGFSYGRLATGSQDNRFSGLLAARDDLHRSQDEGRVFLKNR